MRTKDQKHCVQVVWNLFFLLILVTLHACGGSDLSNISPNDVCITEYSVRPGDFFRYERNMEISNPNGDEMISTQDELISYSQVETIPSFYGYSGTMVGPYILHTETKDGKLKGHTYIDFNGNDIVIDNLETYKRVDTQIKYGTNKPEFVCPGDVYSYYEKSTLYSSLTSDEVGHEIIDTTYNVRDVEKILVPAGRFDCVKIDMEMTLIREKQAIESVANLTGSSWIDIGSGIMIMFSSTGDITMSEYDLTAATAGGAKLIDYRISNHNESNQSDILKQTT